MSGLWIELRIGTPVYRGDEQATRTAGGLMCAVRDGLEPFAGATAARWQAMVPRS